MAAEGALSCWYKGRKRAIKTKALPGTIVLKKHCEMFISDDDDDDDHHLSWIWCKWRKRAIRTKPLPGTINLKKHRVLHSDEISDDDDEAIKNRKRKAESQSQLVANDDLSWIWCKGRKRAIRTKPLPGTIVLKKKKLEFQLLNNLSLDSELLRFESIELEKAECAAGECQIRERISRLCKGDGAIRGCGRVCRYEKCELIKSGGFGAVYKAVNEDSGEVVAVKEELRGVSIITLREIHILMSLPPHSSIVKFKGAARDNAGGVYVVMEHVDNDLRRYLEVTSHLDEAAMKRLMKQLLQGVEFLHENKVAHRDIKPGNILVDREGKLKICDFGLSRRVEAGGQYSPHVGTLPYMAPELLEGVREYTTAVDMWAVGCVMAELMTKRVLFNKWPGATASWQLQRIGAVIGFNSNGVNGKYLRNKIPCSANLSDDAFNLLSRFLTRDPANRITAHSALNHTWIQAFY